MRLHSHRWRLAILIYATLLAPLLRLAEGPHWRARFSAVHVQLTADWRIGTIICYDTFFPKSARSAALNGAELIVGPSLRRT